MRIDRFCRIVCISLSSFPLFAAAVLASGASEVRDLAARADTLMRLGVAEMGASRSFEEAEALLGEAERRLTEADLPASTEAEMALEIAAV